MKFCSFVLTEFLDVIHFYLSRRRRCEGSAFLSFLPGTPLKVCKQIGLLARRGALDERGIGTVDPYRERSEWKPVEGRGGFGNHWRGLAVSPGCVEGCTNSREAKWGSMTPVDRQNPLHTSWLIGGVSSCSQGISVGANPCHLCFLVS